MVKNRQAQRKAIAKHLHRRVLTQLVIFCIVSIVLYGVVIYDALTNNLNLLWIIAGALIGVLIGYVVGKAFKLNWHDDSQKIINPNMPSEDLIKISNRVQSRRTLHFCKRNRG